VLEKNNSLNDNVLSDDIWMCPLIDEPLVELDEIFV
jgi:hypothetical protein